MERNRFTFFKSYYESGKILNPEQRVLLLDAICAVQFLEILPEDVEFSEPILKMAWTNIEPIVVQSINGFLSKTKTDHPLNNPTMHPLAKGSDSPLTAPPMGHKDKEMDKEKDGLPGLSGVNTREDWACKTCGVMNPSLMGCCLECESVR